ncbi:inositol monophosphatase family protein [Cytophagaceae bacterium ABcell3]|nr:inositol monophosphatase family protein [Cytophagaceae bacterium ABcell3]
MDQQRLEKLTFEVIEVVKRAGGFIKQEAQGFDLSHIEYKGAKDMVSYVDKETEKILVQKLEPLVQGASFITEEGTVEQAKSEYKWVIDPLDGTTNFLHGLPSYSISVALIREEEVLLGVVYDIQQQECFYAWKGGGAWLNDKGIKVSAIDAVEQSLIATGFPYDLLDKTDDYFKILKELVEHSHGIRRLGSAAIDLCYVACGRFECYFEFNLKMWDIMAGVLIVKEAGGKVCDFKGGDGYFYGKEVLATGNIQDEMLNLIQKHW